MNARSPVRPELVLLRNSFASEGPSFLSIAALEENTVLRLAQHERSFA
jgi:hypothetical protein